MSDLIYSIDGNGQKLDGGAMFGNAPQALWSRWYKPDSLNRVSLACRCLLVVSDDIPVLFETGIGAFFHPDLATRYGVQDPQRHLLLENLEKAGFKEGDIRYVVLSHLHFDHAGGLLPTWDEMQKGKNDLRFPNAKYVTSQDAWNRALNPHPRDRASFIPELQKALIESGRLTLISGDLPSEELPSKLSFHYSHGHTPGQMHSLFSGEREKVFFCGDLIPGTPWLNTPITMGYDRFPELIIDEKQKLSDIALKEKWLLFYTHDPEFAASRCQINAKGKFEASEPLRNLNAWKL